MTLFRKSICSFTVICCFILFSVDCSFAIHPRAKNYCKDNRIRYVESSCARYFEKDKDCSYLEAHLKDYTQAFKLLCSKNSNTKIRVRQETDKEGLAQTKQLKQRSMKSQSAERKYTISELKSLLSRMALPKSYPIIHPDCFKMGVFIRDPKTGKKSFTSADIMEQKRQLYPTCQESRSAVYFNMDDVKPYVRDEKGEIKALTHWRCLNGDEKPAEIFKQQTKNILGSGNDRMLQEWAPFDIFKPSQYEQEIRKIQTENQIRWITRANTYRDNAYFRLQCVNQIRLQHSQLINTRYAQNNLLNNYKNEERVNENELKLKQRNMAQIREDLDKYRDNLSTYLILHIVDSAYSSSFNKLKEPVMKKLREMGQTISTESGTQRRLQSATVAEPRIHLVSKGPRQDDGWHYIIYISFKPLLDRPVARELQIREGGLNIEMFIYSQKKPANEHFASYQFIRDPGEKEKYQRFKRQINQFLSEMTETNRNINKYLGNFSHSIDVQLEDVQSSIDRLRLEGEKIKEMVNYQNYVVQYSDHKIDNLQEYYWPIMSPAFTGINEAYQKHISDRYVTQFQSAWISAEGNRKELEWGVRAFDSAWEKIRNAFTTRKMSEKLTLFNNEVTDSNTKTVEYEKIPIAFQVVYFHYDTNSEQFAIGLNILYHLNDTEKTMAPMTALQLCNKGNRKRDRDCLVSSGEVSPRVRQLRGLERIRKRQKRQKRQAALLSKIRQLNTELSKLGCSVIDVAGLEKKRPTENDLKVLEEKSWRASDMLSECRSRKNRISVKTQPAATLDANLEGKISLYCSNSKYKRRRYAGYCRKIWMRNKAQYCEYASDKSKYGMAVSELCK